MEVGTIMSSQECLRGTGSSRFYYRLKLKLYRSREACNCLVLEIIVSSLKVQSCQFSNLCEIWPGPRCSFQSKAVCVPSGLSSWESQQKGQLLRLSEKCCCIEIPCYLSGEEAGIECVTETDNLFPNCLNRPGTCTLIGEQLGESIAKLA